MSYNPPPRYTPLTTVDLKTGKSINNPLWLDWFLHLTQTVQNVSETINIYTPLPGSSPIVTSLGGGLDYDSDGGDSFFYPPGDVSNLTIAKGGTYYIHPTLDSYIKWDATNGLSYKPGPTTGLTYDHVWLSASGVPEATLTASFFSSLGSIASAGDCDVTGNVNCQQVITANNGIVSTNGFYYLNANNTAYLDLDVTNGIVYKNGQFDGTYSHTWKNATSNVLMTLTPKGTLNVDGAITINGVPVQTLVAGIDGVDGEDGSMGPPGAQGTAGTPGSAGSTGPMGPTGSAGIPGQDGEDGAEGIPGAVGPKGAAGPTGPTGSVAAAFMMGNDANDIDVGSESLVVKSNETTLNPATISMMGGAISPSFPAGIIGCKTGSAVTAGSIGENSFTSPAAISLTTSTSANVASVTVTAGIWVVFGTAAFAFGATTTVSDLFFGINNVSNTFPAFGLYSTYEFTTATGLGNDVVFPCPTQVFNVGAGGATFYIVAEAIFGVSTCTAFGTITALRIA